MFAKYNAGLQVAFVEITKYQNQVSQKTMVKRMINWIQVQNNLTITLDKTNVKDDTLGNWLGFVS